MLSQEEILQKADELSKIHGCKVRPLVFVDDATKETIVGYYKEPSRMVKTRVLDKAMQAPVTAACELLDAVLIGDASDPRILSESPENDKYYHGAALEIMTTITYSQNQFKKK